MPITSKSNFSTWSPAKIVLGLAPHTRLHLGQRKDFRLAGGAQQRDAG